MNEKKWEELKTPEAVLAAFAAGRRVEWTSLPEWYPRQSWIIPVHVEGASEDCIAATLKAGDRYRALIEEPAGYRAESEQAPAIHGTCSSHCAATGECTNACAPISAQPSQQGDAEGVEGLDEDDEFGNPPGYTDWYNTQFFGQPVDTKRDHACEAAWRSAMTFARRLRPQVEGAAVALAELDRS